jgi:hypothetical protein
MRQMNLGLWCVVAAAVLGLGGCASVRKDAEAEAPATTQAAAAKEEAPAGDAKAPAAGEATTSAPTPVTARWVLSERDKTLKGALDRWAQAAGWRLVWELGVDYRIDAAASIEGTFESAITEVIKNMEHADVPPKAIFYRGNQVLRVVARGME